MARHFWGSLIFQIGDIFGFVPELIFGIVKDWFFVLGINFCNFQKVAFTAFVVLLFVKCKER